MLEATIRLNDGLAAAIEAYLRDHPETTSIPELAEHLIEEFLASQGYVTRYVPLRIPVGPADSGEPTDSVEHDRLFAEAWMSRRDRD
jgi:hypothetical protein